MLNFFMRQLLKSKMKGVIPEADQERFLDMLEKNPEIFKKIAEEAKVKMQNGKSQTEAVKEVMSKYQEDLKKLSQ